MQVLPYIAGFVVFLIVVGLIKKFNQGIVNRQIKATKNDPGMKNLAAALNISYEDLTEEEPSGNKIFNIGCRLKGVYKGFPLEVVMAGDSAVARGVPYAVQYSSRKFIALAISNSGKKKFSIRPKSKEVVSRPTGVSKFDSMLSFVGDRIVPETLLQDFGEQGWMNLELKNDKLIFNDSFYEDNISTTPFRSMKVMDMVHPVWGTSPRNQQLQVSNAVAFIDKLVTIAEKI